LYIPFITILIKKDKKLSQSVALVFEELLKWWLNTV